MIQELRFAPFSPGDERAIVHLFSQCFGRELSEAVWRWRFVENPLGETIVELAWEGDVLVSHYAVTPVEMVVAGRLVKTGLSGTTMTAPTHRGLGLFPKLANRVYKRMFERGLEMVWGYPNRNSHRGIVREVAWRDIYEIPTLRRVTREDDRKRGASESLVPLPFDDPRLGLIWDGIRTDLGTAVARTPGYLRWRYPGNPAQKYHLHGLVERGDLMAYAIHKPYGSEMQIVELLEMPSTGAAARLVLELAGLAKREGRDSIATWCNVHAALHHELERIGFENDTPITYLGARLLGNGDHLRPVLSYSSWHVAMGDSDNF